MEKKTPIKSDTLKSKESLYFPSVREGKWKNIDPDIRWSLEDVLNHVFPRGYQERSYEYSVELMRFILDNPKGVDKRMLSEFLKTRKIPPSTLYNVIIPKLVRFGLLERRREPSQSRPSKGWYMVLKPSISFSTHLGKLASEWRSIYKTAVSE
ncbi:MAG: hypothetical protein DRP11_00205 [Candidatus Aenigmatarchaeota archaeon]|nr:MAG: hypothetical protein DRP11_00205 [Candidatus Aenigmarchaeota archaeon]